MEMRIPVFMENNTCLRASQQLVAATNPTKLISVVDCFVLSDMYSEITRWTTLPVLLEVKIVLYRNMYTWIGVHVVCFVCLVEVFDIEFLCLYRGMLSHLYKCICI